MAKSKSRPNLHYVLVGINKYPFLKEMYQLTGCIRDVNAMQAYLDGPQNSTHFEKINSKVLQDAEATKDNIVNAIENHLGKAQKGDTVLFYFSGHGIREKTEVKILKEAEVDDRLGGIVCHDFMTNKKRNPADTILSNKEFRYLIHQLTKNRSEQPKVHMVLIFDCCHSGSSSRAGNTDQQELVAKQIKYSAIGGRSIQDFVFSNDKEVKEKIKEITTGKKSYSLEELLPQGEHVMLAACREVELAWQPKGEVSVFTRALIDVLDLHKGRISYHELYSRVHNRMSFSLAMKKKDQGQTPQIYVRSKNRGNRYHTFLSNQLSGKPAYSTIEFSKIDQNEGRIDIGALHGLPIDPDQLKKVEVQAFPVGKKAEAFKVKLDQVFLTHSTIKVPRKTRKEGVAYQAELKGVNFAKVAVYIDRAIDKTQQKLTVSKLNKELKSDGAFYHLVEKEEDAEVVIRSKGQELILTKPFDEKRPLVASLDLTLLSESALMKELRRFLQQMGEWWLLKDLEHRPKIRTPAAKRSRTSMYPVELRVFQRTGEGTAQRLLPNGNVFTIQPPSGDCTYLRFEIENHAPKNDKLEFLCCSLVYLTSTFGIWVDRNADDESYPFMNVPQKILKSSTMINNKWRDETWHSFDWSGTDELDKYIDFGGWEEDEDHIARDNWPIETTYLKLIVSRKPFEIQTLHKDSLPSPMKSLTTAGKGTPTSAADKLKDDYWEVRTFEIHAVNPDYKAP